jgi:hypothetical protein
MQKKICVLALVLLINVAFLPKGVWAEEFIAPPPKEKCPVCGLFVA